MTSLKGILYQSGNIDFPRNLNEWAFDRMQDLRDDQEKRIVMNPTVAPIELSRSSELADDVDTSWLESISEIINACHTVNLQRRESTLRLRQAICDISDQLKLVVLVSQESIKEFAAEHWNRIAYFYASRHDGFRFDFIKMITVRDGEPKRETHMELVSRVVNMDDSPVPALTFDATGSAADVNIVEWRATVAENSSGRFGKDEIEVSIAVPLPRQPMVFLYEKRDEFRNRAYHFAGEDLKKQLKRALKKAARLREEAESETAESES